MRLIGNKGHFGLTDAERDAIPQKYCAGPDKAFPCDTQKHFNAAVKLIGLESEADQVELKAKAKEIAEELGWKLPKTWEDDKAEMGSRDSCICQIAKFGEVDGDYIPWGPSVIFECGRYPVQGVDADEDYLDLAVQNSGEAPFKNAHLHDRQSVFSKLDLGGSSRMWREGRQIFGEGVMHKALRAVGKVLSVSVEIDNPKTNPKISSIAVLNYPQVKSAAAVAAFEEADEPVSFAGARHSAADIDSIQAIHDHSVALGALCPPDQEEEAEEEGASMGARHSKVDSEAIQNMHDLAVCQGATCQPASASMGATPPKKEESMSKTLTYKDRWNALKEKHPNVIKSLPAADLAAFEKEMATLGTEAPSTAHEPTESEKAMFAHMAFMENNMLRAKAAEFATDMISKHKRAQPLEREALEIDYMTYAMVDGGAKAMFGADGSFTEGAGVKALRARLLKRQVLRDGIDVIPNGAAFGDGSYDKFASTRAYGNNAGAATNAYNKQR